MSHKTTVNTTLTNSMYLKKALEALNFEFKEAEEGKKLRTKGYYSAGRADVDILLTDSNSCVGFVKNDDGTYSATGDFYDFKHDDKHMTEKQLLGEVVSKAKEFEVSDRFSALGFSLDMNSRKETKEQVQLVFERF
jgi:hypothetical protein